MKLTVSNANITNTFSVARMTLANTNIVESISLGNVSVTPAQITIGNTSITPTAVTVPTLVLGGSQFSGGLQGGIINYQEFTANGTWYNPYANASVNASLTGYEQVLVMAWGGGGGGLSVAPNGGGAGGGACFIGTTTLSGMTNTCSVTVGLGGGNATNGGNSVFVVNSTANIVAYGGSGSISATIVGAGAGTLGLGTANATTSIGGSPLGSISSTTTPLLSTYGGGAGSNGASSNGGSTIFGGGGGGGFGAGNSVYGGGGGSGATTVGGAALVPGTSIFGGRGANTTSAAQIPGGGGSGGSANFTGARGEVRVWTFGPAGTTAGAPTYSLTANTTTLYEGSSVLYTLSTTNVPNGTTFYYTLNNSSTAVATDFTTAVNGSVIINGGTGTFTLTAVDDSDAVNETIQMDIRTGSTTGSIISSNSSVSLVPLPAVTVINRSTVSINSTNQTTYTFTDMAIGTASSTRRVIAVLTADDGSTGGRTLSSATIGGISASIDTQVTHTSGGSGVAAIVSATVPTGTTATVVATYSGGLARASCWVVAIDNLQSTTPYDTLTDTNSPLTGTIDWLKDGFVIAGATMNSDAATFTWSGITERYETDYGTGTAGGGDLLTTTTATNQTITATDVGGTPTRFAMAAVSYR